MNKYLIHTTKFYLQMMFYNHSLEAALTGRSKLSELGIPIHRPDDYFCENVKDDLHMAKVYSWNLLLVLIYLGSDILSYHEDKRSTITGREADRSIRNAEEPREQSQV
jgi:hypothetical protein